MAYDRHLHGQLTKITATKVNSSDVLYEQELSYEDASGIAVPRFDGRISQIKSSVQAAGGTVSDDNVYIYDMMGNMTRKLGTGAEAWFSYDENGRVLTQDDATGQLVYSYAPKSYRVESVAGSIGLDASRNASRKNNFVYDASGRVVADSSKNLSIEYDMGSQPVMFTVKDSSGTYASVNVYDPQGWRVGVLGFRDGKPESWRTDIMLDGRKELERHVDLSRSAGSVSAQNATEYKMLYGAGGMLGRENANGAREWYVKNYQGSLVMTVVNDAVGNVIAYEPFGAQKLLQADGDKPAEQYTGKELDESTGLYYYGARFFDPTFAMWLAPDPANQYLNPYGFGGDPVNAVDPDGRWGISHFLTPLTSIASAVVAAKNSDSFGEGVGAFFIDLVGNNFAHMAEPTISATSVAWGAISSIGGVFHAAFGDGNWGDAWKPLAVSVGSLFVNEYDTWNNAVAAGSRGDYGEIFTNLASTDINAVATDYYAYQYSANKGFGSQKYTYEGSYEGSGGHRNQVWGQKTNDLGSVNAKNLGQNIALFKNYYAHPDTAKQRILNHEYVHARQQSKYGLGGMAIRKLYREKDRPLDGSSDCGMFGFTCDEVINVFNTYNNDGTMDYAEIEAQLNSEAHADSKYWFDAPIFY